MFWQLVLFGVVAFLAHNALLHVHGTAVEFAPPQAQPHAAGSLAPAEADAPEPALLPGTSSPMSVDDWPGVAKLAERHQTSPTHP